MYNLLQVEVGFEPRVVSLIEVAKYNKTTIREFIL